MAKGKVLVGLSGGVDSAVSAALLLKEGYEVVGGFMKNWSDEENENPLLTKEGAGGGSECSWRVERRDAMRVAAKLGIPFLTFDFEAEYRKNVYEYMIKEYKKGRTPNPDVLCNKYMKFDLFLREADKLGCAFIATGHYARVHYDRSGAAHLLVGVDEKKDQSYFLCQLTQSQLARTLFPIGNMRKTAVRAKARKLGLPVADKKDSQGICFVGQVLIDDFLRARIAPHDGNIVTTDGRVVGTHHGFEFYTIGQRGGLGVGGGVPLYVVERRPRTNEIVVAVHENDSALYQRECVASNVTETVDGNLEKYFGKKIHARIRYRQPLAACVVTPLLAKEGQGVVGDLRVIFDELQRAVAPGQFVALYDGEELVGSGVIR